MLLPQFLNKVVVIVVVLAAVGVVVAAAVVSVDEKLFFSPKYLLRGLEQSFMWYFLEKHNKPDVFVFVCVCVCVCVFCLRVRERAFCVAMQT